MSYKGTKGGAPGGKEGKPPKAALRNLAIALDKDLRETTIAVRTLTIRGSIAPGTAFDPDRIARALWQIANSDGVVHEFTGAGD